MNRLAKYHARGGLRFVAAPRPYRKGDVLDALPYHRTRFVGQRKAGHERRFTEYGWLLSLAMRPARLPHERDRRAA